MIKNRLEQYGCNVDISDPYVIAEEAKDNLGIYLKDLKDIKDQDAIIIAVCHEQFKSFIKRLEKMPNPKGWL